MIVKNCFCLCAACCHCIFCLFFIYVGKGINCFWFILCDSLPILHIPERRSFWVQVGSFETHLSALAQQ
jgi:hypothetical protein